MCGIVGYMSFNNHPVEKRLIENMCDTIIHRGPDDTGTYVNGNIGIGMRRLSIIDLSTGRQPISTEDDRLHIVFNGEIYNYKELKKDLLQNGHRFKTDSDTEVILHLYEDHRADCLQYLNGMFTFAIWDQKKKELFCARDRLGIKPFYYYADSERLIFGSELKTILEDKNIPLDLDLNALSQFLTFEFIPFPETLFKQIKKLPPGYYLKADENGVKIQPYWHLEDIQEKERTEEETIEELYALLKDAVRLRLRSDVPFGAFLSGGIDSGTIVGLMSELLGSQVKTFSIGFENQSYNELTYARQVAELFDTDHTDQVIEPSAIELIETLVNYMDDPIADFSIFPTYLVSHMAREKVKVVLSGDGGDELFGGYDTYVAQYLSQYYSRIPGGLRNRCIHPAIKALRPTQQKKGVINKVKRFTEGASYDEKYDHFRWMIHVDPERTGEVFQKDIAHDINRIGTFAFIERYLNGNRLNGLNRSMFLDVKSYLTDNILVKVDRMSMATSLEARVPFLDHRVVEFAMSVPQHLKIRHLTTKYVLKKMAKKLLPEKIIHRPKQGFSIPIKNWLQGPVRKMMEDVLSYSRIQKQGIFNPDFTERLLKEHLENKENHSHRLWALILFQLWRDRFFSSS